MVNFLLRRSGSSFYELEFASAAPLVEYQGWLNRTNILQYVDYDALCTTAMRRSRG